jgi:hypothetical protein
MGTSGYLLDTTEFNAVAKGAIPLSTYAGLRVFATHVQLDELNRTTDAQTRARLVAVFEAIGPKKLVTETAVWGVSKWGEAKWSTEDGLFQKMLARLIQLAEGWPRENAALF